MKSNKFDLVFITAGPYYTIPLCKISNKEFQTKCIIDYRDLWIFDIRSKAEFIKPTNLLKKLIYFPIENRNIKHADLIVTVTENWKNILKKVYNLNHIKVIENGYDDKLLKKNYEDDNYSFEHNFVITVFGKLSYYSTRYGIEFFSALKRLELVYPDLIVLHIGEKERQTEEALRISGF